MKTKEKFQEGAKVTADNQIFGTPNSNAKNGTGDSPNDNVRKKLTWDNEPDPSSHLMQIDSKLTRKLIKQK